MDTNVAVVANGHAQQAGVACRLTCIDRLDQIREHRRLLLDDRHEILEEYRRHLRPSGQPGAGDAFFKWLWDHQGNEDHCRRIRITPEATRGFEEFPDDPALETFDRSDRKFVAVALAGSSRPPVLNAADSDWWEHRRTLERHGIDVDFLCPELMDR